MGASLGREGAPKQAGAVIANLLSDRTRLADESRRLLVACGAGAGMAAAYGVPLGGALFALEVLRGELALRFVLPALVTSLIATGMSWAFLPDAPTYLIPVYSGSISSTAWALLAGPIAGAVSVGYVRLVALADHHRPKGTWRVTVPVLALTVLGTVSIWFPQLLGNGRDVAQLAVTGQVAPLLLMTLLVLKPAATILCLGSGAPGGLFTPSLALGALLGGALGYVWTFVWPGDPPGLFAVLGAGAILAATTQGPISTVVPDDGTHGTGKGSHRADAPDRSARDAGGPHDRATLDLRRAVERLPRSSNDNGSEIPPRLAQASSKD